VELQGIYIGNKSVMASTDFKRGLLDTGTTLIFTSDASAANIHAEIPGAKFDSTNSVWTLPCDTSIATGAPNVYFEVGGRKFGVPPSDLPYRQQSTGACISGIQGGSPVFTVLGDVFLTSRYLILDYGDSSEAHPRVGLADRADSPVLPALS
jgi:hypothetical protein